MLLLNIVIALVPSTAIILFICLHSIYFRYISQGRWTKVPPTLQAVQFLEGASAVWNNPFFLGLAGAKSFSPCPFAAYLYHGDLLSWGLFLVRLLALIICATFWCWLYRLGYEGVGHYLNHRYKNQFLVALYNANVLLGTVYIYKSDIGPLVYSLVDFLKTGGSHSFAFVCFLTVTSVGGFTVTMFAVIVHCLLDLVGQLLVVMSISSVEDVGRAFVSTPISPCYSNLGVAEFLPVLSQLITILPIYHFIRTARSPKKLKLAIAICAIVLLYDQFWSMLLASKVKEAGIDYTNRTQNGMSSRSSLWVRSFLDGFTSTNMFARDKIVGTWSPSDTTKTALFEKELWDLSPVGAIILFWSMLGQLNMFTVLQLHSLTVHIMKHCTPAWLRNVVVSSISELKLFYTCVRFLASIAVLMLIENGIYDLSYTDYRGSAVYLPRLESILAIAVCIATLIAWGLRNADPALIITQTVVQIIGMYFLQEMLGRSAQMDFVTSEMIWEEDSTARTENICQTVWLPTLLTFVLLLVTLSAFGCCSSRRGRNVSQDNLRWDENGTEEGAIASKDSNSSEGHL